MKRIFSLSLPVIFLFLITGMANAQNNEKGTGDSRVIIIQKKSGGPEIKVSVDSVSKMIIEGRKITFDNAGRISGNSPGLTNFFTYGRKMNRMRSISGTNYYGENVYGFGSPKVKWVRGYKIGDEDPEILTRAFLGVSTKANSKGAEVVEVTKESPAAKAGIQKGDIITKVGDQKIASPQELADAIKKHEPGNEVDITLLRNNKTVQVKAKLSGWQNMFSLEADSVYLRGYRNLLNKDNFDFNFSTPELLVEGFRRSPSIGLQVQDTENESGVTVLKVESKSAAETAGVKVGDLITSINNKPVKGVDDVVREMRTTPDNSVYSLKITRDGKPISIDVKIPKKLRKASF